MVFKSETIKQMTVKPQGSQIMFCWRNTVLAFTVLKNKVDLLPALKIQELKYEVGIVTPFEKNMGRSGDTRLTFPHSKVSWIDQRLLLTVMGSASTGANPTLSVTGMVRVPRAGTGVREP